MTGVETTERPAQVVITPQMEQIIKHMLETPRGRFTCSALTADIGFGNTGTVHPHLQRMEAAGWIDSEYLPGGPPSGGRRREYWFTTGTTTMLRKALRG